MTFNARAPQLSTRLPRADPSTSRIVACSGPRSTGLTMCASKPRARVLHGLSPHPYEAVMAGPAAGDAGSAAAGGHRGRRAPAGPSEAASRLHDRLAASRRQPAGSIRHVILDPDWKPILGAQAERSKGQACGGSVGHQGGSVAPADRRCRESRLLAYADDVEGASRGQQELHRVDEVFQGNRIGLRRADGSRGLPPRAPAAGSRTHGCWLSAADCGGAERTRLIRPPVRP